MGEQVGYRAALERLSKRLHQENKKSGGSKTFEEVKRATTERVKGFEKRHPNRQATNKE